MSHGVYDATQDILIKTAGMNVWADLPVGAIIPYGGATAPSGWMLCQGQSLLRASYPELFAVIGTAFGSADSTHFNIPDMRESVPKGAGLTGLSNNHIDADGLFIGEFIDDQLQDHVHSIGVRTSNGGSAGPGWHYLNEPTDATYDSQEVTSSYRKGNTTEVKAVGVNYIIKAKQCAVPTDFMAAVDEAVSDSIIVKKGTWTGSQTLYPMGDSQTRDRFDLPITFDSPMPDYNYTVVIEFFESRYITIRSASKTASGFHIEGANADNNANSTLTKIIWTAIRFPS